MTREISLIQYRSFPFKDHWAFFIPNTSTPTTGTIIHVEGSVREGFKHQIKRNYDLARTTRSIRQALLGRVEDRHLHTDQTFEPSNDTSPRDDIEVLALAIPAPGPSMNPTAGNAPPTMRVHFSDCQWWLRQVAAKLVEENILGANALAIMDSTPKN